MIEIIIKQYLDKNLDVLVFLEHQEDLQGEYVLFERTSGGKSNKINSAIFAFQSYADSLYKAALLNEKVKEVVENLIILDEIGKVKLNSDYNFTDTTTKKYRYQAVFDISY